MNNTENIFIPYEEIKDYGITIKGVFDMSTGTLYIDTYEYDLSKLIEGEDE